MLLEAAIAIVVSLWFYGLNARMLTAFEPDVAWVVEAALVLLCLPVALRAGAWARRAFGGNGQGGNGQGGNGQGGNRRRPT